MADPRFAKGANQILLTVSIFGRTTDHNAHNGITGTVPGIDNNIDEISALGRPNASDASLG